jgi:ComF family protein
MVVQRLLATLSQFCYPSTCAACDARFEGPDFLCHACQFELMELELRPRCERCAMPLAAGGNPCPYCMNKGIAPLDRILRLTIFTDPIKPAIHHMKYHRRWGLAEAFADRLLAREDVKTLMSETDVLVPMPLYWTRQVKRGYNQSEVLARRLAKRCDLPVRRAAKRVKDTPTQTGLRSQAERWENVRDAFRLTRPGAVRGKHVVVIDDVMTTGSTLKAVARELAKAKPASISGVVIAIADPKGRGFEAI